MNRPRLVVDLETYPGDRALEMTPPVDWLEPPGNFKNADTIAKWKADREAAWPTEVARVASLDWRLGKIAAIGWQVPGGEPVACCSPSEGFMLQTFWETVAREDVTADKTSGLLNNVQLAGFGIASFDLPWLLGRSALLRIKPPRRFQPNRYDPSRSDVIDWQDILAGHDPSKKSGWSLARYAEVFGLPKTVGTGAEVADWMKAGQTEKVVEHLTADVVATTALHTLMAPGYL